MATGQTLSRLLPMTTQVCLLTLFTLSAAVPFNPKSLRADHSNHLQYHHQQQQEALADVEEQLFPSLSQIESTSNNINSLQQPQQQEAAAAPVSYAGYKLFKTDVQEQLFPVVDSLDVEAGVEVWSCRKKGRSNHYEMDLLTPPHAVSEVRQVFIESNVTYQEVIDDLQRAINMEGTTDEFIIWNRPAHPMNWHNYHTLDEMYQYMDYLAAEFPQLVTVEDIGMSFEKRPLRVVKVSTGGPAVKPIIFIDGGIHAREWVSPATALFILHRLVEFGWQEPQLLDRFDWFIMPMVNPDGYVYTQKHDRLWRKSRSNLKSSPLCSGVDLNRNFGFKWSTGGSSPQPCSSVYAGPEPFSEPESRALRDILLKNKKQLKIYISLHAYSEMWLLPYAYTDAEKPNNYGDIYNVSVMGVETIRNTSGHDYRLGQAAEILYRASGNTMDYAHSIGIPFTFSLELRDKGKFGFILPKEEIEPTGREFFQAMKTVSEEVYQKLQATSTG
ncbi:hypothetical protein Pcinc_034809 [Petrolisthes cinctipes]|uniref:Peptidase M14 domain-containing protein n=1 Tax=Petrolisthes cinctipes TaxID=88211 RepID=A0AAE1ENW4_PETCI|nr:hypothetical protein Pcinc_034809 [Petrolisthes cinctipes]